MSLPMLGTKEQTEKSKYQISLVDNTNKSLHPMEYPRINRFFDTLEERNTFIQLFEKAIYKNGGKLIHKKEMSHPYFESFNVLDNKGNTLYDLTIYK